MHTTIQVHHTTSKEQAKNKRLKKFLMAIGENGANLKALMDDMDLRNRSSFVNTYKLIDKQGVIHPLYWQHSDNMNSLIETIDKMNQ